MNGAGVYILRGSAQEVLYVGQSAVLDSRLGAHMGSAPWKEKIASIDLVAVEDHHQRDSVERELIRALKPRYNQRFMNLPSNDDMQRLHFVWMPHAFYDGVRLAYGFDSDAAMANFLKVTPEHITLARLRLVSVSSAEQAVVAEDKGCTIWQLKFRLPKSPFITRKKPARKPKVFPVPCSFVALEGVR